MSKDLDEAVRLQSEKKRANTRDKRRETTRNAEATSSVPRLASSLATSFPERNEYSGTHCSLIVQEEREDRSCQICQRQIEVKEMI